MHISAVLHILGALGGAQGTALGLSVSQSTVTAASIASNGALAASVQPSASATSAGPITLSTGANGVTILMPSSAQSVIEPHLEEQQNCGLLPSGSLKRDTSAGLSCAITNAKAVMRDASLGTPLYNDLILSQTTCPNLVGPFYAALQQLLAFVQTLVQWGTQHVTPDQQTCTAIVVLALAYSVWSLGGVITSVLIPNSWTDATPTVASSASCPSETFPGTPVPVCCNVTQCNGDGTYCGSGSSWPNCPCLYAESIEGMPIPSGILSQDLLQSIVSFTLPPLPATSAVSTASTASSTARGKVPYYIPVDHPGGGTQGTNPV